MYSKTPAEPYAFFWWQFGFSSVYRIPQLSRNPLGTAYLVTATLSM